MLSSLDDLQSLLILFVLHLNMSYCMILRLGQTLIGYVKYELPILRVKLLVVNLLSKQVLTLAVKAWQSV